MSDARIALAVIADDRAIEEGFERMIDSVADQVDGAFIAFTGSNDNVFWQISEVVGNVFQNGNVAERPWQNDFSLARNLSFELVRDHVLLHASSHFDWIIWLDCDDILTAGTDLQRCIAELNENHAHAGFMPYYYQYDVEREQVLSQHAKERLLRADVDWVWVNPIHENCTGPIATRMMQLTHGSVTHLRSNAETKRERNVEMIREWYKTEPDNPRALLWMAHATFEKAEQAETDVDQRALYKMALTLYRDYVERDSVSDDAYTAQRRVAECCRIFGRFNDAINISLQCVKMQPTWPMAYLDIATTHHLGKDYEEATTWARMAGNAAALWKQQDTLGPIEPLDAQYRPLMIEADCKLRTGDYEGAYYRFLSASHIYCDEFTEDRIREANNKRLNPGARKPDPKQLHRSAWGSKPEKSIAFYAPTGIEPWNPDILEAEGLGGTETTVMRLAEELGRRHWRVSIFGDPGDWYGRKHWNVEWYRSQDYHPDEPFTAFVSVRAPVILDAAIKAKTKILWMHDVNSGNMRFGDAGDRLSKADAIVTPSLWHARHLYQVYEGAKQPIKAATWVISNGIDHKLFSKLDGDEVRNSRLFVYASSPDRGLVRLLDLWPRLAGHQSVQPSLEIFYGFDAIDKIIDSGHPNGPALQHLKDQVLGKIDQLNSMGYNIFMHGRVRQEILARRFRCANMMLYPANFCETFGIVFAQAMAAGVVPVTSALGNLKDLVPNTVSGSPDNEDFAERFIKMIGVANEITDDDRAMLAQRVRFCDWSNITRAWTDTLTELIK